MPYKDEAVRQEPDSNEIKELHGEVVRPEVGGAPVHEVHAARDPLELERDAVPVRDHGVPGTKEKDDDAIKQ
jgi:hypothetical protein